jgi:HSP20 family molecular chaperone IbpA
MTSEIIAKENENHAVENLEVMPPVDIVEDSDGFVMYFEVPGCNSSSVKAEVENNILTVECASVLRRGKRPVMFKRVFRLSRAVDVSQITAAVEYGVLTLKLPKAEHVKPFKVPVA